MDIIEIPVEGLQGVLDSVDNAPMFPQPQEYNYWVNRKNRIFYVDYEIDDDYRLIELMKTVIQINLEDMTKPVEDLQPIVIMIHSYGGSLHQANIFSDVLISSRTPVITVALGVAMSGGFNIFLAGHKRYVFRHTSLLVHQGMASFEGSAQEIEEAQKNYKKELDEMRDYILDRTEIDEKTFNKNRRKDWYLAFDEIQKYKIGTLVTSIEDIFKKD